MKTWSFLLALMLWMPAAGAMERLDDSLSPQQNVVPQLQWAYVPTPGRRLSAEQLNAIVGHVKIDIRLRTQDYIGKHAQIFLRMPLSPQGLSRPGGLRVNWTTELGTFASGTAVPGEAVPIYNGPITEAVMRDLFDMTFHLDARYVTGTITLKPEFEIQIQP
ncbi:MAG: hypothetical protein P8Y64_04670 [Gammaproteobacteria bacterium]|jgi:hypothetical protein